MAQTDLAADQAQITLPVIGMTCAACQHHVEQALRSTAGVETARVDLMAHRARITFDPAITQPEKFIQAIRGAGYDAVLPRAGSENAAPVETVSALKAWLMLAAGAAAMLAAMPLSPMGGMDATLMRA